MTPCRKCGSFNLYAAWDEREMQGVVYLVVCGECEHEASSTVSHKDAWDEWEAEND